MRIDIYIYIIIHKAMKTTFDPVISIIYPILLLASKVYVDILQ